MKKLNVCDRIKKKREELGMSQEELANKLGYKSRSSINKIEMGLSDIPFSKIKDFAVALETTEAYIMGWEVPDEIPNSIPEAEFVSIPLYASISAGYGSCQNEFIEMLAIPGIKSNGSDYFAVKVRGESMEPKIPDESIVIIKKDVSTENGDIGAFYYNGDSYVKQKKYINGKMILHSFNMAYDPIIIQPYDDFKEYGKVVKVLIDL